MKTAIVCGSIQKNATTLVVADELKRLIPESFIIGLHAFREVFDGNYIYLKNASSTQKRTINALIESEVIVFVVPTYYRSMPGALKNFFDIVRESKIYKNKVVAVVASNHKNQDYGARHALEVLQGLSVFFETVTVFVPEILITNHQDIDYDELKRYVNLVKSYVSRF